MGGIVLAAIALTAVVGCAAQAPTDSGIRGTVRIGPVTPVQRQGEPADAPFATGVVVRDVSGNVIARTRSAADGSFTVRLVPGSYTVEGDGGTTPPTPPAPQSVTVRAHEFVTVTLVYDSGIR
jgi:hypothetical protein